MFKGLAIVAAALTLASCASMDAEVTGGRKTEIQVGQIVTCRGGESECSGAVKQFLEGLKK